MISGAARPRFIYTFTATTALYWVSMYFYMPILAVHAENLGASMGLVGAILGSYGFMQLVLRIPIGIWSDRVGLRMPFIIAGIAASGLGALVMGLTSDPMWLVVGRGLAGVGAAAWVAFTVLISSYFPAEQSTRAMSWATFVSAASMMVAAYAGGIVAQNWGWVAPFYGAAALGALGVIGAMKLAEKPLAVRRNLTLGELRRIMTVPLLVVVSTAAMLGSWNQWVTVNGFSLIYAAHLGADRGELGFLTMMPQLAFTVVALPAAYLADRLGLRTTMIAGLALQAVSAFMVPMVDTIPLVAVSQAFGGAGRGLSYPVMMGLSIRAVAPGDRATAMGAFQAVYALGMFGGPAFSGALGDAFGLSSVFVVAGLMVLVGIAIIARGVRVK